MAVEKTVLLLLLHLVLSNAIRTVVDEGDIAYLSCNSGTSIKTKSAFFGYNRNPKCEDSNALSVVQGLVDGLSDATVVASATSFTSTCAVGTAQQLIITYVCESSQGFINKREGETATLTCPSGRYITVSKASFGIGNRCGAPNAFTTVKDACQFQETCTIAASNTAIPGTTCTSGTQRLQISYICDQSTGGIFTRWGYNTCPVTAKAIYTGVMAGGKVDEAGSGSNYLCISDSPDFTGLSTSDETDNGKLIGQQLVLDTTDTSSPFPTNYDGNVIKCAVCQLNSAQSVFTYPGKPTCPKGWNTEYGGYLAAPPSSISSGSRDYVCLDSSGDDTTGYVAVAAATGDGKLGIVEGQCSANLCDYYTDNAELTCSVCSK